MLSFVKLGLLLSWLTRLLLVLVRSSKLILLFWYCLVIGRIVLYLMIVLGLENLRFIVSLCLNCVMLGIVCHNVKLNVCMLG